MRTNDKIDTLLLLLYAQKRCLKEGCFDGYLYLNRIIDRTRRARIELG